MSKSTEHRANPVGCPRLLITIFSPNPSPLAQAAVQDGPVQRAADRRLGGGQEVLPEVLSALLRLRWEGGVGSGPAEPLCVHRGGGGDRVKWIPGFTPDPVFSHLSYQPCSFISFGPFGVREGV